MDKSLLTKYYYIDHMVWLIYGLSIDNKLNYLTIIHIIFLNALKICIYL